MDENKDRDNINKERKSVELDEICSIFGIK
jgi:hypothetical protein